MSGNLTNRIAVDRRIAVRSVNGPDITVIEGQWHPADTNGASAVRAAWVGGGAVVSGFTLRNGATRALGDTNTLQNGGGAWCASSEALLVNCVLSNNAAAFQGGGVFGGRLEDCTLVANFARDGGGACSNALDRCLVMNNAAWSGGGVAYSTLKDCELYGNQAGGHGGGARYSTLVDCTVAFNDAMSGGGTDFCKSIRCRVVENTAYNGAGMMGGSGLRCIIMNNVANDTGAGVSGVALTNSAVVGNRGSRGSGAWGGILVNCTVTRNEGGGARAAQLRNSILWGNSGYNYWSDVSLQYSCSDPLPPGIGNINANPLLLDGVMRIAASSPCRGKGAMVYATDSDIDGEEWANPPSMGCDEVWEDALTGPLLVSIEAGASETFVFRELPFTAHIEGRVAQLVWSFDDGASLTNNLLALHAWSAPGDFTVTATVFNADHPSGVSTNLAVRILPLESPQLGATGRAGEVVQFAFASQAGADYLVEVAADLSPPVNWQPLETIIGTGGIIVVTDSGTDAEKRFYRVRVR